jgi:hypothetical protein
MLVRTEYNNLLNSIEYIYFELNMRINRREKDMTSVL